MLYVTTTGRDVYERFQFVTISWSTSGGGMDLADRVSKRFLATAGARRDDVSAADVRFVARTEFVRKRGSRPFSRSVRRPRQRELTRSRKLNAVLASNSRVK